MWDYNYTEMGCRLIIHSLSALILTGGLALCATALFTTVWQTLSSNSMGNRTVGLYERCVEQSKAMSIVENTRSWVCSYHDFEKKQSETTKDPHIIRGDVECMSLP